MKQFNMNDWTIMNEKWSIFAENTSFIDENDLWPPNQSDANAEKNLINAKLFPVMHLSLNKYEINYIIV